MSSQSSPLHAACPASAAANVLDVTPAKRRVASALWDTLDLWQTRIRGRTRLAELDDRLLKDIGLSRSEAYREAAKPVWLA